MRVVIVVVVDYEIFTVKNICSDKDTPVHAAVRSNQQSVVRELLQMEADINSANNNGDTALTLAVGTGNEELLQDLLAAGSNPANQCRYVILNVVMSLF